MKEITTSRDELFNLMKGKRVFVMEGLSYRGAEYRETTVEKAIKATYGNHISRAFEEDGNIYIQVLSASDMY